LESTSNSLEAKIKFESASNMFLEKEGWLQILVEDSYWGELTKCMNYPVSSL
jgi:hypothetical protein